MSTKEFPRSDDEWKQDVWPIAGWMALLHYHMAKPVVDRLVEAEGRELLSGVVQWMAMTEKATQ